MKCVGLTENKEPITPGKLFPLERFSNIPKHISNIEMKFDQFVLKRAKTRITKQSWDGWLDLVKGEGCLVLNCSGAPYSELIILSKGAKYAVFIQEKHQTVAKETQLKKRKIPTLDYKDVALEHKKYNVATPHLFVMITDELFVSNEQLKNSEIVLPADLHKEPIVPLLALLRKHNHAHHQPEMIALKNSSVHPSGEIHCL